MKTNKLVLASTLLAAAVGLGVAGVACGSDNGTQNANQVVLADFEEWAPDFQILRLREEFGAIEVNSNPEFVKSGKQSAKLYAMGWEKGNNPYFFIHTQSEHFDFDYTDFSHIDYVSTWLYNPSDKEANMYVGFVTDIATITEVSLAKPETFVLKKGWNEIIYKPDMNYVISGVGVDNYEGIKGVYFMFDKAGVDKKADAPQYYMDDVTLHYGEELEYTPVRAGTYYSAGSRIGGANGMFFKEPVPMEKYKGKALQFEFRFASEEGRFGFIICGSDWANITGTLVFAKQNGEVSASVGKIFELEDGWYRWMLNEGFFPGDGAYRAVDVGLIYHQGITTQGEVEINWLSLVPAEPYEYTREEVSDRYETGDYVGYGNPIYLTERIPLSDLEGNALQLDFKIETQDGKFGFVILTPDDNWSNLTGDVIITKKNGILTSNVGKIEELEDGWYVWKLNREVFAGDGLHRESADNVGLIYHQNIKIEGIVHVNWRSLKVVEAYTYDRDEVSILYENGAKVGGEVGMALSMPVKMSDLDGKALHFEFKFTSENGYFAFVMCDRMRDWANTLGVLKINKKGNDVWSNMGRIVALDEGWYAWELNRELFLGDGAARAQVIDLIYHQGETVQGSVYINWMSVKVVDAYEHSRDEMATRYSTGEKVGGNVGTSLQPAIAMSDLVGKALRFEFKIEGDGSFGFAILASSWANAVGTVKITKSGDNVTAENWCNLTYVDTFRLIELEDGWYAFELNHADFVGDGLANATDIGLIYHQDEVVSGTVYIDWTSFAVVDAK